MTEENSTTYHDDPLYSTMNEQFQRGDWKEGMDSLSKLMKKYPLDPKLWQIMHHMNLRSKIDRTNVKKTALYS